MKDKDIKKPVMFWTTKKLKKEFEKKCGKNNMTKVLNELIENYINNK